MHVEDPNEELQRLRAQVADMQAERDAQDVEATRTKKARTLSSPSADLVSIQSGGAGCVRTQSDVMLTLIDAADNALREVGRSS